MNNKEIFDGPKGHSTRFMLKIMMGRFEEHPIVI